MVKEKGKILSMQLTQQSAQLTGIAKGIQGIGGKVDVPAAAGGALSQSGLLTAAQQASVLKLFGDKTPKFTKLYEANKDGWSKSQFAPKVYGKGFTFHVIKISNGRVVGGYIPMNLHNGPRRDFNLGHKSWIFYFKGDEAQKLRAKGT